jgi:hypothetical protein
MSTEEEVEKRIYGNIALHLHLLCIKKQCQNTNDPYILLVGMRISTTTMESSRKIPQKAKDTSAI